MGESDRELMERLKTGDVSAFDVIVQRHKASLINFACRSVGDQETAEDLAQETFLKVYRNAKRYKGEIAGLRTWMYRILANLCKNELGSRSRRSQVMVKPAIGDQDGHDPIETALDTNPGPDGQLEEKELQKALTRAISNLPEKLRVVLVLRDIEGMAYEEISRIIKKPIGTVKSRINRARLALKDKMAAYANLQE